MLKFYTKYHGQLLLFHLASGDGECIMRFCPSFQIVQFMREGMKAQEACDLTVDRMLRQTGQQFEVAVIALDTKVSSDNTFVGTSSLVAFLHFYLSPFKLHSR